MTTKKKDEALLMLLQVLNKACDDMDYIAQGLNTEQRNLLNAVNDTVLDARTVVSDIHLQDKKDGLLMEQLEKELSIVLDFLSENRLMAKFIEHKSKYEDG